MRNALGETDMKPSFSDTFGDDDYGLFFVGQVG